MNAPQKLATPAEVAAWLDVTERQLRRMRSAGNGPRVTRIGHRTVRYAWNDVIAYATACRAKSNAGT